MADGSHHPPTGGGEVVGETVRPLFSADQIAARVRALAVEIEACGCSDLILVGLLKGCFVFLADLVRALDGRGCTPQVDFVRLTSYGAHRDSSGTVRIMGEVPKGLAGRDVLIVDDIVDTGRTLTVACNLMRELGAKQVRVCALLDKPSRREVEIKPNYVGFEIPDVFVVGYGIDHAERHRHLPYIATID